MDWKSFLVKGTGIASIALGSQLASADIICNGCAYPTDLVVGQGAFLGAYDPATNDTGSYTHLDIQQDVGFDTPFDDLWVFDILADADGSTSANIAPTTLIKNFKVDLWSDNGTICAPGALPTKCALLPNQVIASIVFVVAKAVAGLVADKADDLLFVSGHRGGEDTKYRKGNEDLLSHAEMEEN